MNDVNSKYAVLNSTERSVIKRNYKTDILFRIVLFRKLINIDNGELTIEDNGETYTFGDPGPDNFKARIQIINSKFYSQIFLGGEIGASTAYMKGYWKSDDLVSVIRLLIRNKDILLKIEKNMGLLKKTLGFLYNISTRNTIKGSRKNIEAHYDLSNYFYSLFLDETEVYPIVKTKSKVF